MVHDDQHDGHEQYDDHAYHGVIHYDGGALLKTFQAPTGRPFALGLHNGENSDSTGP